MTTKFLLDTTAYALLFHKTDSDEAYSLKQRIDDDGTLSFYISEITSLEIYSVIGKYRRGIPKQKIACNRKIIENNNIKDCNNIWFLKGSKRISRKLFHDLQKFVKDVELQRGHIKANIIRLTQNAIKEGTKLLIKYSDRYNFGSHDALIAGSLIDMKQNHGIDLTLATSDKGFKAALSEENIHTFDPKTDAW